MKLHMKAFALTCGVTWGLLILLTTFWFLIMGYEGATLVKLSKVYLGYSVTWFGAFIGLIWGFVDGLIVGGFFSWLYNKLAE